MCASELHHGERAGRSPRGRRGQHSEQSTSRAERTPRSPASGRAAIVIGRRFVRRPLQAASARRARLVQFDDAHRHTGRDISGGSDTGTPVPPRHQEGSSRAVGHFQVGIPGRIYARTTSTSTASTASPCIDIDQVKARGSPGPSEQIRRVVKRPAYMTFRHRLGGSRLRTGTGTPEVGGSPATRRSSSVRGLSGLTFVGGDIGRGRGRFDDPSNHRAACGQTVDVRVSVRLARDRAGPLRIRVRREPEGCREWLLLLSETHRLPRRQP